MDDFQPTVVVKLHDDVAVPYVDAAEQFLPDSLGLAWQGVAAFFPFLSLNRLFTSLDPPEIEAFLHEVRTASGTEPHNLLAYFTIAVPAGVDLETVRAAVAVLPFVEYAEIEAESGLAIVNPADDPMSSQQTYFDAAPVGVDARHAWTLPFADGAGVRFVDVEYGWFLDHEDLINAGVQLLPVRGNRPSAMSNPLSTATQAERDRINHGTAMVGIVLASDNARGIVGLTPGVHGAVAVAEDPEGRGGANEGANALLAVGASPDMGRGSVLLLEIATGRNSRFPFESNRYIAGTILDLTKKGITVIEPAGNGNENLDQFSDPFFGDPLNRFSNRFFDTGAIMVGAGDPTSTDHPRLFFSNFGSRIDCYAWGDNVFTSWAETSPPGGLNGYLAVAGTSPAGAIIAGVAIAAQNLAVTGPIGDWLSPADLRALLSRPSLGTTSVSNDVRHFPNPDGTVSILPPEPIGSMPDLRRLADFLHPPV